MKTTTLTTQGMSCQHGVDQHCIGQRGVNQRGANQRGVKTVKTALSQVKALKRVLCLRLKLERTHVEDSSRAPDLIPAINTQTYTASVAP